MSRKARNYIKASFFHIMVQGLNKEYIFDNNLRFTCNELNSKEDENIIFLEDDSQLKNEVKEFIENYLIYNNLRIEQLKQNNEKLKQLIEILKYKYNISLRKIAVYLNISREKIRVIAKETRNEWKKMSKRDVPIDQSIKDN